MTEFNGKVVLITGATSGLGATAAITLAAKGAKVADAEIRAFMGEALAKAVREIEAGK